MKLSEIRLVAAWLAEKALDALLPASDPQVRAAEKLARAEEDAEAWEPLGEFPAVLAEQLRAQNVPAGVEPDPPVSPGSTGGHPVRSTSDLLKDAAVELSTLGRMAYYRPQAWINELVDELTDRAAQLRAHGD